MAQAAQAGSGLSLPAYSRGQGLHTRRCAPIHPEHMGATTRYHRAPSIVVVGRIYADFAQALIKEARALYVDDGFAVELDNAAYALDASTIDLCISLFPWAKFRRTQSAVKLHTLQDLRGNIPTLVFITDGKVHDVNILDQLPVEPGAFYIMDRGYLDFGRLFAMHQAMAFFIIPAKKNFNCRRLYSAPVDKTTGVQCDQTVLLNGFYASKDYPEKLRRIRYFDADKDKRFVFLTNNFDLPAKTVADLYRCRWQVELFFKWIKQHLRIKKFYGTTENAVKTQIWIAISVYVLIAIVKKRLGLELSLYTILQILSVSLFEKTPILQAFSSVEYGIGAGGTLLTGWNYATNVGKAVVLRINVRISFTLYAQFCILRNQQKGHVGRGDVSAHDTMSLTCCVRPDCAFSLSQLDGSKLKKSPTNKGKQEVDQTDCPVHTTSNPLAAVAGEFIWEISGKSTFPTSTLTTRVWNDSARRTGRCLRRQTGFKKGK